MNLIIKITVNVPNTKFGSWEGTREPIAVIGGTLMHVRQVLRGALLNYRQLVGEPDISITVSNARSRPGRERVAELLRKSDEWLTTGDIVQALDLNPKTVREHLRNLREAGHVARQYKSVYRGATLKLTTVPVYQWLTEDLDD